MHASALEVSDAPLSQALLPPRPRQLVRPDRRPRAHLGPDKDAAFKAYHGLMQQRGVAQRPAERLLVVVVDRFLDYVQKHRDAHTYRWYKDRLQLFLDTVPATLTVEELKP